MTLSDKALLRIGGEAAVWLGVAAFAWMLTYEFADEDMLFRWGAAIWPRTIIIALAFGAVVQFFVRYRALLAWKRTQQPTSAGTSSDSSGGIAAMVTTAAMISVPLLYLFLLPRTGYYLTTPFFIALLIYLFGIRRPVRLIVITIAIYVVFLLIFTKILFVPMPTGYWPGFYELNNSIVEMLG